MHLLSVMFKNIPGTHWAHTPLAHVEQFTGQAMQDPFAAFSVPAGQKSQFGLHDRSGMHLVLFNLNPGSHA